MGKVIKAAAIAFAVTFIAVGITAMISGGSMTMSTFMAGLGGVSTTTLATLSGVSTLVMGLISKGSPSVTGNFGSKLAAPSATAPRQIIYGQARVGGTVVHMQTTGTDNYLFTQIIALAGHECEELVSMRVDDKVVSDQVSGDWRYVTTTDFTNSSNDNAFDAFGGGKLIRFRFVDGSQTTADTVVTSNSSLTSTDVFTEVAYVMVQIVFDSEKFSGNPRLSFIVKGKKVYDPRDSSHSSSDSSTWEWSDNPALCLRDYLTNTTYGLKATDDEILDSSTLLGGFGTAANTCDASSNHKSTTVNGAVSNSTTFTIASDSSNTLIKSGDRVSGANISGSVLVTKRVGFEVTVESAVTLTDGQTVNFGQAEYTCNGFADMAGAGKGIIEGLLSSCAGRLSYINGKFIMFAGSNVTPEMTITDDDFLAPASIKTKASGSDHHNQVKAIYVDRNEGYIAKDTPLYEDATLLAADTPTGESSANYRKVMELQLPFTDNHTMAQRIGKSQLLHSRQATHLLCVVDLKFIQLQPFDWVYVTNDRLGFNQKIFEVLSMNIQPMGEADAPVLGIQMELKEMNTSVYNFLNSEYEAPIDEEEAPPQGDATITAPTGLTLTQNSEEQGAGYLIDIAVTWTNNTANQLINGTEIQYKLSTDSDYTGDILSAAGVSSAIINNVTIGKTYNVRIAHTDVNGNKSDYTDAVNITITDPTPSIDAPTNFTATSRRGFIELGFTTPDVANLSKIKLYRHTAAFTPTDDTYLVSTYSAQPNSSMTISTGLADGLAANTVYRFALRAQSNTGIHSAFTSVITGSFTQFELPDITAFDLGDIDSTADTKLSGIEAGATVGATFGTDLFDTDGSTAMTAAQVKNNQITLSADGSLANIGTSQILSNASIAEADLVGSGKTFSVKPNKTALADGSTEGAFTFTTDGGNAVGVNVFSSAERTKLDRLRLGQDPADATKSIQNNDISINPSGQLAGIGTGNNSIVNNANIVENDLVGATKAFSVKPNKAEVADGSTEGIFTISVDGAAATTVNVFSSAERTKLDRLRAGQNPANASQSIVNNDISLSLSGTSLTLTGGGGSAQTFSKASVGLSDLASLDSTAGTKLGGIEAGATVGATFGTDLFDTDGSTAVTAAQMKNDQITLAADGSLANIGTTQIVSNADIAEADIVGSGKTFSVKPNKTETADGSTEGIFTITTDGGDATTVNVFSSAERTKLDRLRLGQDPSDATKSIKNDSIAEADIVGTGKTFTVKPNKTTVADGSTEGIFTIATDNGAATTVNVFSSAERTKLDRLRAGQNPANASQSIVNNDISLSLSGTSLSLTGGGGSAQTLGKANVGLSDLASLDSTAGTKLGGIAEGATVGAVAGTNLKKADGTTTLNDADIVTSEGTANDTANVSGTAAATVENNAAIGENTASNLQGTVNSLNDPTSSLNITGERITGGVIEGSLIKADELLLTTKGTAATGTSISINTTTDSSDYIADLGTGAGMYFGGISINVTAGTNLYQGSVHLDIREGSGSVNVYEKYFPVMIQAGAEVYSHANAYSRFERTMHMEFMFFYSGTATLKAYLTARASASSGATATVTLRAAKFGAEGVNQFNFTDELTVTQASNNTTYETSNTVTLTGFSGSLTASISGHSSAEFKVNSGSFGTADQTVTANDTVQVRILVPQTAQTTRSATLNVGGVADTYTIRTSGTYSPDPDDTYSCFPAGTLIMMEDGEWLPIEQIIAGDRVSCYTPNGMQSGLVTHTQDRGEDQVWLLTFADGSQLRMTDGHPLYSKTKGWVALNTEAALGGHGLPCELLEIGDELITVTGSQVLESVLEDTVETVYNITVAEHHNYYADGFLAHNLDEIKP